LSNQTITRAGRAHMAKPGVAKTIPSGRKCIPTVLYTPKPHSRFLVMGKMPLDQNAIGYRQDILRISDAGKPCLSHSPDSSSFPGCNCNQTAPVQHRADLQKFKRYVTGLVHQAYA
jgi:hypothetical protein